MEAEQVPVNTITNSILAPTITLLAHKSLINNLNEDSPIADIVAVMNSERAVDSAQISSVMYYMNRAIETRLRAHHKKFEFENIDMSISPKSSRGNVMEFDSKISIYCPNNANVTLQLETELQDMLREVCRDITSHYPCVHSIEMNGKSHENSTLFIDSNYTIDMAQMSIDLMSDTFKESRKEEDMKRREMEKEMDELRRERDLLQAKVEELKKQIEESKGGSHQTELFEVKVQQQQPPSSTATTSLPSAPIDQKTDPQEEPHGVLKADDSVWSLIGKKGCKLSENVNEKLGLAPAALVDVMEERMRMESDKGASPMLVSIMHKHERSGVGLDGMNLMSELLYVNDYKSKRMEILINKGVGSALNQDKHGRNLLFHSLLRGRTEFSAYLFFKRYNITLDAYGLTPFDVLDELYGVPRGTHREKDKKVLMDYVSNVPDPKNSKIAIHAIYNNKAAILKKIEEQFNSIDSLYAEHEKKKEMEAEAKRKKEEKKKQDELKNMRNKKKEESKRIQEEREKEEMESKRAKEKQSASDANNNNTNNGNDNNDDNDGEAAMEDESMIEDSQMPSEECDTTALPPAPAQKQQQQQQQQRKSEAPTKKTAQQQPKKNEGKVEPQGKKRKRESVDEETEEEPKKKKGKNVPTENAFDKANEIKSKKTAPAKTDRSEKEKPKAPQKKAVTTTKPTPQPKASTSTSQSSSSSSSSSNNNDDNFAQMQGSMLNYIISGCGSLINYDSKKMKEEEVKIKDSANLFRAYLIKLRSTLKECGANQKDYPMIYWKHTQIEQEMPKILESMTKKLKDNKRLKDVYTQIKEDKCTPIKKQDDLHVLKSVWFHFFVMYTTEFIWASSNYREELEEGGIYYDWSKFKSGIELALNNMSQPKQQQQQKRQQQQQQQQKQRK